MATTKKKLKQPMQPVVVAPDGVVRFLQNRVVRWMLDELQSREPNVQNRMCAKFGQKGSDTVDDYQHLMQLIGYSVGGYGDLECRDRAVLNAADAAADKLITPKREKPRS